MVILAGTNDIAGNTGPASIKMITDNIMSMAELAIKNKIHVILSSVLPAASYPWKPGINPVGKIITVNNIIKTYAENYRIAYLDYYSSMVTTNNALKQEYTYDGVHPNRSGYELMSKLADQIIFDSLKLMQDYQ